MKTSIHRWKGFRVLGAALVTCTLLTGTGCDDLDFSDPCTERRAGTSVCHGNSADYCGGEKTEWSREDCGAGVCVMKGGVATCVEHDTRHPRCDWNLGPSGHGRRFCDGSTAYQCDEEGYATAFVTCDSAEHTAKSNAVYCVEAEDDGFCAESPEPEPLCAATVTWDVCDGSTAIDCHLGYRRSSEVCEHCVEYTDFHIKLCAVAPAPDPACSHDSYGFACVGNAAIVCDFGYRITEEPCGDGYCVLTDDAAYCTEPIPTP